MTPRREPVSRVELHGGVSRLILAEGLAVRVVVCIPKLALVHADFTFRGSDLDALVYAVELARGGRFRGRARVLERRAGPALVAVFATRHGPADAPAVCLEVTREGKLSGVPILLVGVELDALERAVALARTKDTPKEIAS